jgi:hypothetical protein
METHGTTMEELNTMKAIQAINQKIPEVTLRDLFAMVALQGILAGGASITRARSISGKEKTYLGELEAGAAYKFADAMLLERRV